ncbi:MAG TPA: glycosyltransferase, partial [Gemmatimonadaceae bacterium]
MSISSSEVATSAKVAMTVVIPTLNEGAQIAQAVDALSWIDEIIVVDGGSMDDTAARAECAGARVIVLMGETIAGQRNAGTA